MKFRSRAEIYTNPFSPTLSLQAPRGRSQDTRPFHTIGVYPCPTFSQTANSKKHSVLSPHRRRPARSLSSRTRTAVFSPKHSSTNLVLKQANLLSNSSWFAFHSWVLHKPLARSSTATILVFHSTGSRSFSRRSVLAISQRTLLSPIISYRTVITTTMPVPLSLLRLSFLRRVRRRRHLLTRMAWR